MPGFPLPLRNALAALAIGALEEDGAEAALRWLAAPSGAPPAAAAAPLATLHLVDPGSRELLPVHAPHAGAVAAYAARALAARAAYVAPTEPGASPIVRPVRQAAALWNARLFFEVHEVLEAVWKTAAGEVRHALQGVIQIAVAYHHLAHGNRRGARSLMAEGRGRLASVPSSTLAPLDVAALLAVTSAWKSLRAGEPVPDVEPPRLVLHGSA